VPRILRFLVLGLLLAAPAAACGGTGTKGGTTGTASDRKTPIGAAIAYVGLAGRIAARTEVTSSTATEGGTTASATVTFDGLLDDSTRAERWVLREARQEDGTWKIESSVEERRCQPGRGHQGWGTQPCV
jgi:hypothetical protein